MYSPQEIEKKRLKALELKKARMQQRKNLPQAQQPKAYNAPIFFGKRKIETSPNVPKNPPAKQAKEATTDAKPVEAVKGSASMISFNRFEIDVPYHQPLINFFRKFPSRGYDQKTRFWSFNISEYEKVMQGIKAELPNIIISPIPKFVLQTFANYPGQSEETTEVDLSRIDQKLLATLMPFQKEGISFAIRKNGRCIIADDMGLGKTIQALGVAHYYRENWPLLIVTPSSVRYQWSEAILEYLPSVLVHQVHQITSSKDMIDSEKITIVSYDILARSVDMFEKRGFGMVICDESHVLKNHKTARTKAIARVVANATRVLLLSGTPALSRPIELYSQIKLFHRPFMALHEYGTRYCGAVMSKFGMNYCGSCNTRELQLLLKASCLIRRLKADVLKQLPSKIRQVIILDPAMIAASTKKIREMEAKLEECQAQGANTHKALVQLYNESSSQRVAAVTNYIKDILENDQKFLVFAHHQCVLDSICELLRSKKVKFIRIDGKTPAEARKTQVDTFQNSPECQVAVLSITAANTGITLTAAHFVVFAELFWNPGILCQAEDRVHRIGQDSSVLIQYLVAKKTADDYLWPLIQMKLDFLSKAGLNQDFSLKTADVRSQNLSQDTSKQMKLDSFLTPSAQNSVNDDKKVLDDEEDFADINFNDFP